MPSLGHILIVDDEPHVRHYLALVVRALAPLGVHQAADGAAALALAGTLSPPPDLILLDVNMPGIDGLETLRRLRAAGHAGRVVMLTSLTNRQTVEGAIEAGADHYLRKDTPREEIIECLRRVLATPADESTDESPA